MGKKLISLGLAAAMLILITGCGVVGSVNNDDISSIVEAKQEAKQTEKERVIAEAQAYLEENYPDDEFTYVSGRSPNWADRYFELGFSSEKYDDQIIIVYGDPRQDYDPHSVVTSYYRDENGDVIYDYYDTYFEYTMKDEAEEYFSNIIKDYIDDDFDLRVAFFSSLGFAMAVDNSKNFVDNYTDGNVDFTVYVFTEDYTEDDVNSMVSLIDEFKKNNKVLWLDYIMVNSISEISDLDIEDIRHNYHNYYKKQYNYSTTYDNNPSER